MVESLRGDPHSYRQLLGLLSDRLRRYFVRCLGEAAHEVEPLVQETLIAINARRATYDRRQQLTAWVHAIAHHKLKKHRRRSGRVLAPADDLPLF